MSVKTYNTGDIIWFSRWDMICEARITEVQTDPKIGTYYEVHLLSMGGEPNGGSTGCLPTEAYPNRESCLNAMTAHSKARIDAFCADIRTMPDLVQFMLDHVIAGEDCDWDARQAAIRSAKRLGIPIRNE